MSPNHPRFSPFFPVLILSIAGFFSGVYCWGPEGHEIVATIAQIYTEPAALARLCRILPSTPAPCHLATVANWADENKRQMLWSAPLHFVGAVDDNPPDACLFPGPNGWAGKPDANVLAGVFNTSQILLNWADTQDGVSAGPLEEEALKFIVHFLGDMHMPLHMTGRLRGGNQANICFDGRKTNLHSSWDDDLPEQAISKVPANYSVPLPFPKVEESLRGSIYDAYVRRIVWEGIEDKWADSLLDWISCPSRSVNAGIAAQTIWQTLRDFFLPGRLFGHSEGIPDTTDTHDICPYHWAIPTHDLVCELVWPKELDQDPSTFPASHQCHTPDNDGVLYELNNADYMRPIEERMILEQQLAKGGIRLAAILNHIFGGNGAEGILSQSSSLRLQDLRS